MNDTEYLLTKMEGVFQIREGRPMSDREKQFAIAAAHDAIDYSHASCDVSRMRTLLKEQPALLDTVGSLALSMAATYFGTLDAVRFLLEQGVRRLYDTQTGVARNYTHEPISGAFEYGNFETLRTLFEAGVTDAGFANLPWIAWPHKTSLLYMSIYRPLEYAEFALAFGADIEEPIPWYGEGGATVLQNAIAPPVGAVMARWHNAERWGQGLRFAEFLLGRGAHYDIYSACGRDDLPRVRSLAAQDPAVIGRRGNVGMTPLHWAVRGNAVSCTQWLLAHAADVEAETETHRTPLHMAAEWGLAEMVWLLAAHGARLDDKDSKGRTPLHRATYMGELETAEILIVLGANINIRNKSGKTALEVARKGCLHLKDAG